MKIIDAHNHPDWHGHDLDKFLQNMDKYGIDQTWLLSWECPLHEYSKGYASAVPAELLGSATGPIPFSRCVSYKERAPERFILGYAPDPRRPNACELLQAAHEIYGARVCGEFKIRIMMDDRDAVWLFRKAGELKMPVVFHLQEDLRKEVNPWSEWWGGSIDSLERALQLCPETTFLGHAPGFWIHISGDDLYKKSNYAPVPCKVEPNGKMPQLLRKYPNLYCDWSAGSGFSALKRDPVFAKEFILEFQDRFLYARDYFDNQHQEFLYELNLPKEVLEKVFHKNAEKLVRE